MTGSIANFSSNYIPLIMGIILLILSIIFCLTVFPAVMRSISTRPRPIPIQQSYQQPPSQQQPPKQQKRSAASISCLMCGSSIKGRANFCPKCGGKVK